MKYFLIALVLVGISVPAVSNAATGDITGVRIHPEGWYAEVDIEGFVTGGTADFGLINDDVGSTTDNLAANAKLPFTVTSQGYNEDGILGTITRTVYGTKLVRKAYPGNTSSSNPKIADEVVNSGILTVKVVLSDYIYNDDKNGGAGTSGTDVTVSFPSGWYRNSGPGGNNALSATANLTATNNSAMDYPKVIARFAWPGYEKVSSDFLVEAVAFHRFAQYGKPVAAVAYSAADQSSNKTYATSTAMTVSSRSGDANKVLVYASTLDIDTLTQANNIEVNFIAYPWVGDEDSVFNTAVGTSGFAQPDERGGPLFFVNDKAGTYGTGYALVSNTGSNTTGQVYSSQSAAEAGNAFQTIGAAAVAIKTFHNNASNTAPVRNSAGGGVILLAEGNYAYPGTNPSSDLGTMNTWLTIKPASTASRANTKISSGANSDLKSTRVKIEGLTLSPSTSSGGGLTGRTAGDVLWLHNNIINATNTLPLYNWRMGYATQNSVTALNVGFAANYGASRGPFVLVRGNDAQQLTSSHVYTVLGNKNVLADKYTEWPNAPQHAASNNSIIAFNSVYGQLSNISLANTQPAENVAIIQNLYERIGSNPTGIMDISSAGGNGSTTNNVLTWHNTFVGERVQWAYNSSGSVRVLKSNFSNKYNIFGDQGTKSDTFTGSGGGNGNRTGNWSVMYNVGTLADKSLKNTFPGDFDGLYSQRPHSGSAMTLGFVNDRSRQSGNDLGNGDYQLNPASIAIDTVGINESFYSVLPYDLLGNPRYGSADTGAYEYQPPYTVGSSNRLTASSTARIYGNEKFRLKSGSVSSSGADLEVSIAGSDTSKWLDVTILEWSNSGTNHKAWMEISSTTGLTNTVHIVGDLEDDTNYEVKVDNVAGQNITGTNCTAGICTSNSNGEIEFTYTGSYSSHRFDVEETEGTPPPPPPDETAPNVTSASPSGDVAFGTTQTTLQVTTDEIASCKYATTTGTLYADMPHAFDQTATTTHTKLLTGLTNYTSYSYYVRCQDIAENASTSDYLVSFAVASSTDSTSPHVTSISYSKPLATTTIGITVNFSEAVTSTGTVTLTTSTAGTCDLSITSASSATCFYEFGSESIGGFRITDISGTIRDAGDNALAEFGPVNWTARTETY